ncbi:hypothetical protein MMC30_004504 [Trapelia coarctata]|nr:hypothetical protein [Trapelia coarctata]
MPFVVEEVNIEKDWDELFKCQWAAWTNPPQPFWELMCPVSGEGPAAEAEAIKAGADHLLQLSKYDPNDRWVKVTDIDTGKIIAGALWKICSTNPFRAPPEKFDAFWWPEGSEFRELLNAMFGQMQDYRQKMMNVAHAYLAILFTHPDHRNRGAGSLLTEWGTRKADESGLEAYVESSVMGKPVYEKCGFVVVMGHPGMKFENPNPSDKWKRLVKGLKAQPPTLMWRPSGGKYEAGKTVIPWEGKPRE